MIEKNKFYIFWKGLLGILDLSWISSPSLNVIEKNKFYIFRVKGFLEFWISRFLRRSWMWSRRRISFIYFEKGFLEFWIFSISSYKLNVIEEENKFYIFWKGLLGILEISRFLRRVWMWSRRISFIYFEKGFLEFWIFSISSPNLRECDSKISFKEWLLGILDLFDFFSEFMWMRFENKFYRVKGFFSWNFGSLRYLLRICVDVIRK